MNCRKCGQTDIRPGAKFCPKCGLVLEAHTGMCPKCQTPISSGMRFCRHCGKSLEGTFCPLCQRPNRAGVKFCTHCGVQLTEEAPVHPYGTGRLPPGLVLGGKYLIVAKIAQGGMGAVYEAISAPPVPDQKLAVKEMSFSVLSRLGDEQQKLVIEGFRREFELLSKLQHPNLVRAYEFFEEQSRHYFVMEYLNGQTLETIMESCAPGQFLPVAQVMSWARQLCEVLAYLHSQTPPIIYRDLKPSNIMQIADTQTIKLFDFGIARFYKPGQKSDTLRFGTEGYLAPEIVAYHTQTNERTDIYALGALLHQLLTHYDPQIDPWQRPSASSINPKVPERVASAIEKALALKPEQRIPNARVMLEELFGPEAIGTAPELASPDTPRLASLPAPASGDKRPADFLARPIPQPQHMPVAPLAAHSRAEAGAASLQTNSSAPKISAALPAEQPSPPAVPPSVLDLGSVKKGLIVSGLFQVVVSPGCSGQVQTTAPWLFCEPDRFSKPDTRITVHAQTANLPLAKWKKESGPGWFTRLPGFLRGWLGLHTSPFMPLPQAHRGMLQVAVPGAPTTQVAVMIEVRPSTWRVLVGWFIVLGLIGLEIGILLGIIAFVLLFLI